MPIRRLALAVVVLVGLAGCATAEPEFAVMAGGDDWVVVSFADDAETMPVGAMDLLLDTEMAADEALADAGAGFIDGNEIGDGSYDLYFVGDDSAEMWRVLEPVFAEAPVPWTSVQLLDGLEDPDPTVLQP